MSWLNQQTGETVRHFEEWKQAMKTANADVSAGKKEEAMRQTATVRDYYSDYVGHGSAYEITADVYLGQNKKAEAVRELEHYRDLGGTDVETLKKLARIELELGKRKDAERTFETLNYIYPEDEEIHRKFGGLLLSDGDAPGAVREYTAVLAGKPSDVAESHFDLAKALTAAHRTGEAKDQVLLALEAAPDYKPAQQLLLQLSQ
jgi:tetratricopeptide (TPR) repeat protein